MPISLSNRLLGCAAYVQPGARVIDVGADHGYLAIYLLQRGLAQSVLATDLREKPLESARRNARRCRLGEQIRFLRTDGLDGVAPDAFDTLICAGMGADSMIEILRRAPWLRDARYRLILQPQSAPHDLRRWLSGQGYCIERERLCSDGGFLYCILRVRYAPGQTLSPAEQFLSPPLLQSGDPLLPDYLRRIGNNLEKTVAGLRKARQAPDAEKLAYYTAAYDGVRRIRENYDDGK